MSESPERSAAVSPEAKRALLARLLREKSGAANGDASSSFVHKMIDAQASRTPDGVAVAGGDRRLTYRELAHRSDGFAARLRAGGIRRGDRVAVALDRTPELVVALVGVLKAGAAYVPLDPTHPRARLAYQLDDARASLLLTTRALRDALPDCSARVICLDAPAEAGGPVDASPAAPSALSPDDLAYVLYTSGSTGRPKGAMITHRGLSNYLGWASRAYEAGAGHGAPVHSPISFDLTVTSLFAPLVSGGRVDLLEDGPGVEALADALLADPGYSLVKLTPAHLDLLAHRLGPGGAAGRARFFVVGGEQLTADQVAFWRQHAPETAIINEYGPTETVVGCCTFRVPADGELAGAIAIGKPIAQTKLYVLDRLMRPVPLGVAGELYIGGAGVARGYLGRPGLTAEKFVPDPLSGVAGARLYRSGDLARWRPDGQLEFLGRIDGQVKVRGYRIELGEIEAVLRDDPAVRAAAVVAREDTPGEKRLVAYLATDAGRGLDAEPIRARLREALPEYMVPAAFVGLDALPLSPNGKVDRDALPAPEAIRASAGAAYAPPRGPVEEAISGMWSELLAVDRVGVHDHFFDLGGHSLLATRLLARVRGTFAVETSLREFLDQPTVAGLARLVDRELAAGSGLEAPPMRPSPRGGPLPASFAQQRLWFLDQMDPGSPLYNVPLAVHLDGPLDVAALRRAIHEVVRRHEVLRTTFASDGGVPTQVIAPTLDVPVEVADLSGLPEPERQAEASKRVEAEARRPFDLARGPLVRAGLLRLADREHIAWVMLHHIASDGWSLAVLTREVAAAYEAFRLGRPSPLPEPTLQYADFAAWQRGWLSGDVLDRHLAYWTGQLAGVPDLELPTDRPRRAHSACPGGRRSVELPRSTLDELRAIGRQEGATLFMTILAAFDVLLGRYSGQADFAVGTPIAGRTRSEVEDLIGCFINSLVLRADLSGDPSFLELLRRVRASALGAYAHQELPFERIVSALQSDRREVGRTPLFRCMFALQNAPPPPLESTDMVLRPLDLETGLAKFDLTLFAVETEAGLDLSMEYDADLFDGATVDRMLGHLRVLLDGIAEDPGRRVGLLPMMTEAERRGLMADDGEPDDLSGLSDAEVDAMLSGLSLGEGAIDE